MRDTPDAVEKDGMECVLSQVASQLGQEKGVPLLDPSAHSVTVLLVLSPPTRVIIPPSVLLMLLSFLFRAFYS